MHINLVEGYKGLFEVNPHAISFVFNKDVSQPHAREALKRFQGDIDQARLGGRYYQKPLRSRLNFLVSPEGFNRSHPHYHGIISLPDDVRVMGLEALHDQYGSAWRAISPGGSLDLKPIYDWSGWVGYASKESCLLTADNSFWSIDANRIHH